VSAYRQGMAGRWSTEVFHGRFLPEPHDEPVAGVTVIAAPGVPEPAEDGAL